MSWWTRNRLIGAGAIVAVAAAAGVYLVVADRDHGELIEGPSGVYPEALGEGDLADPSRVVATAESPRVVDGLGIEMTDSGDLYRSDDVLRAVDLRTGEEYWSYRREEANVSAFDVADRMLYVLWGDDLLVGFDPRTAEPSWHTELGDLDGVSRVLAADGLAVVLSDAGAIGVDTAEGERLWTTPPTEECGFGRAVAVGATVAVTTSCDTGGGPYEVVLFDRDGERAAVPASPTADLFGAGEGRFAVADLYEDVRVYDAGSGEPIAEAPLPTKDHTYYRVGDHERLIAENFHAEGDAPLYTAWDLAEAAPAWTVNNDDAWDAQSRPRLVDGSFYTLRREASGGQVWELIVYDAATGEQRTATSIDLAEHVGTPEEVDTYFDFRLDITDMAHGTITVTIGSSFPGSGAPGCGGECGLVLADPA